MNQVTINSIINNLEKVKKSMRQLQKQRLGKQDSRKELEKQIDEAYDSAERARYLISKLG